MSRHRQWLTIVIPAYNEQDRIVPTISDIAAFITTYPDIVQKVIIVDDGSRDATIERVMPFKEVALIQFVRLAKNSGKWAAIRAGLAEARTDAILLMDADGSAPIWTLRDIMRTGLLSRVMSEKVGVFASRFHPDSKVYGKSGARSFVSQGYRVYVKTMYWLGGGDHDISDMQIPWKLFFKSKIEGKLEVDRFAGDIDLALRYRGEIVNVPVKFVHVRGSKVPVSAVWNMAIETMKVAWRARMRRIEKYMNGLVSTTEQSGEGGGYG